MSDVKYSQSNCIIVDDVGWIWIIWNKKTLNLKFVFTKSIKNVLCNCCVFDDVDYHDHDYDEVRAILRWWMLIFMLKFCR